jgi:HK97 family phage major capsid protein
LTAETKIKAVTMKNKTEKLFRALGIVAEERKIDLEKRTVILPFSSDLPIERWGGKEILVHSPEAIDLKRLNNGAAVLEDHGGRQIGVVERAWLHEDGRLWAELRFSKNQQASEVFQDIADGIRRNVSFGYQVREWQEDEDKETKEKTFRATNWMPFEVSIVAVPADPTVGVGRSLDDTGDTEKSGDANTDGKQADAGTETNADETRTMPEIEGKTPEPPAKNKKEKANMDKKQIQEITKLGRAFNCVAEADAAIEAESSVEAFQAQVLDLQAKRNADLGKTANVGKEIGMTDHEVKQYSILRAIRALANPDDAKARKAAAFELECSRAYAEQIGRAPAGIFLPPDVQMRTFNLTTGAGSNLRATDLRADMFIELLRAKSVLAAAGARMMGGLVGNVAIPAQTAAGTGYWFAPESANITSASNPTIAQVPLAPKTVGAYTDISRLLLMQSTPDAEMIVRDDLNKVLALAIDLGGLKGAGTNEPTGITNTSGISDTYWGVDNAPTFAEIVAMETVVDTANALAGTLNYVMPASLRGVLKTTAKDSGSGLFVATGNETNGYPILTSNQLAAGECIFGNFSDLIIGMWGGLDIQVDPYTLSLSGSVRVRALQSVDIAIRHAASFAYRSNNPAT